MTWKSRFINDTDNKDIGTCVAEWVEPTAEGEVVILRYESRVETQDKAALKEFAKGAQKLLDDKIKNDAEIAAKVAEINALLAEKQI